MQPQVTHGVGGGAIPANATTSLLAPPQHTVNTKALKYIGIANVMMGSLSVILGIATISLLYNFWLGAMSSGIWCGASFIVAGCLAISASSSPTNNTILGTTMAFNIIANVLAFFDGIAFIFGVINAANCKNYSYSYYNYYYHMYYTFSNSCGIRDSNKDSAIVLFSLQLVIMIAEFNLTMIAAILCCSCCRRKPGVYVQPQPQYESVTISTGHSGMTPSVYPHGHSTGAPHAYTGGQQGYPAGALLGHPAGAQLGHPTAGQQAYHEGNQQNCPVTVQQGYAAGGRPYVHSAIGPQNNTQRFPTAEPQQFSHTAPHQYNQPSHGPVYTLQHPLLPHGTYSGEHIHDRAPLMENQKPEELNDTASGIPLLPYSKI